MSSGGQDDEKSRGQAAAGKDADVLVSASGVSKRFKVYPKPSGRLVEWMTLGRAVRHEDFWALRDVSIEVRRGECLGVIGENGSGKSTLLKILTGTMSASGGTFAVDGRLLALIELGTGFNRELTGAENIRLAAQLLGLDPTYVEGRFDDIAAFASLGDFLHRPIRVYSSGMMVRLAFSLFVFLEPDVLIVDEALAVGDAAFQRKCYRRMEEMITNEGRAVVLVTHDMSAVTRFCTRAVWLDHGRMRMEGEPEAVVQEYLREVLSRGGAPHARDAVPAPVAVEARAARDGGIPAAGEMLAREESAISYDPRGARVAGVWLEDDGGRVVATVGVGRGFALCYAARFETGVEEPVFGMRLVTMRGDAVLGTNTHLHGMATGRYGAGEVVIVRWPVAGGLGVGDYFISCGVSRAENHHAFYGREVDAYRFQVVGESVDLGLCALSGRPALKRPDSAGAVAGRAVGGRA